VVTVAKISIISTGFVMFSEDRPLSVLRPRRFRLPERFSMRPRQTRTRGRVWPRGQTPVNGLHLECHVLQTGAFSPSRYMLSQKLALEEDACSGIPSLVRVGMDRPMPAAW
jgi:hypothetical protein